MSKTGTTNKNGTRTSNSIKNITFNFGSQIVSLVLGFVNRSVFLYCLDVGYLGVSGLFSDIFSMLSLADLGFGTAMVFSMYKPLAEKDYDRLAGLVDLYKRIYRVVAISILIIGVCITPFLKYIIKLETDMPNLHIYYLLYLANTIASYLVIYRTCILSADQKGYILTKYRSISSIIQTAVMTVLLFLTRNYILYLIMHVAFTYATNIYLSYISKKMYPFIGNQVKLPWTEAKEIFSNIKSVFLYKLSSVLLYATDNTLISIIVGTEMVGYYSNYTMIGGRITSLVNTLFYSLTASLGNLIVKENKQKRYEIFQTMQSVSVILSTICITCIFFLQEDFIKIWIGGQYILPKTVLIAMTLNLYLSIALVPIWTFREATGLYRKTKYVMLTTAAVNLIMSVVMGKAIGLAGIIFASAIARLSTYFWIEPKLLFKTYFGHPCSTYFINLAKSLGVTTIVFVIEFVFVTYLFPTPLTWFMLVIKAICVGGISVIAIIVFYHNSEGFKLLFRKTKEICKL